jgi:U3 small nucleolar RNA-associated protein 15
VAAVDDMVVAKGRKPKLLPYDKFLKTFEYASALDSAMATHDPIIITSILRELIARDGLTSALAGRTEDALEPILLFVVKYIADPRFSSLLLDIANGSWVHS